MTHRGQPTKKMRPGSALAGPAVENFLIDEDVASLAADAIALGDELLIRNDDGIAGDLKLTGKLAGRRQLGAGWKGTIQNSVDELLTNTA